MVFYEITPHAIREAIDAAARHLAGPGRRAAGAPRARLPGRLQPVAAAVEEGRLPGASAGRVQSPALRMICEREEEIEPSSRASTGRSMPTSSRPQQAFPARLIEYRGEKVEQFTVTNEQQAADVRARDRSGRGRQAQRHRRSSARSASAIPAPPFTTSTLQQEAARKLGFGAQRTMRLAQQLYEGVDFGEGAVGLITYMRTDSVNLADEAVQEIREVIAANYGAESLPDAAARLQDQVEERAGSARSDAPDLGGVTPERLEGKIDRRPAQAVQTDLEARGRLPDGAGGLRHRGRRSGAGQRREARRRRRVLRANGSTLVKPGYIAVYKEGRRRRAATTTTTACCRR